MIEPLRWDDASRTLYLLDQTRLPVEEHWMALRTIDEVDEAIVSLRVRGAPAIAHAACFALLLAVEDVPHPAPRVLAAIEQMRRTRPTAVNLFHAMAHMERVVRDAGGMEAQALHALVLHEARRLYTEDQESGRRLGELGLSLLPPTGGTVMTICHTGGVATSGYGTALATLILGHQRGLAMKAIACETRPLLQGARITSWELDRAGVEVTLITDNMAAYMMASTPIDAVIVGADRIAANGDTANKIGTYGLAVLARHHGIPFYVSAPLSTLDVATPNGAAIHIEERKPQEVTHGFGRQTAPAHVKVRNPAFDVTPAALITALITDRGIVRPPYTDTLLELAAAPSRL